SPIARRYLARVSSGSVRVAAAFTEESGKSSHIVAFDVARREGGLPRIASISLVTSRNDASTPPSTKFLPDSSMSTAAMWALTTSWTEIQVADPGGTTRNVPFAIGRMSCRDQFVVS